MIIPENYVGIIYKRTNRLNRKVYVGKTKRAEEVRWQQHIYDAKHGSTTHFHNALNFHGIEVWIVEILYYAKTFYELKRMETFFIILHQSINPEYGYNMTLGGDDEDYPNEEMKEIVSKKISYKMKLMRGRTHLRICYACFRPFNVGEKANYEGTFCSRECMKIINLFPREKRNKPAWNSGKTNVELFGAEKAEELRLKNSRGHTGKPSHRKGKTHTIEAKKLMSDAKRGKPSPKKDIPCKEETKRKLAECLRGRIWITNGVKSRMVAPITVLEEGWWRGVTVKKETRAPSSLIGKKAVEIFGKERAAEVSKKQSLSHSGKIWITNSIVSTKISPDRPIPEGFWRGRKCWKQQKIDNIERRRNNVRSKQSNNCWKAVRNYRIEAETLKTDHETYC